MKTISDLLKTAGAKAQKIIWILGVRAFSLILFFIAVGLIFGGFIFYRYDFLAQEHGAAETKGIIKFDDKIYQRVLNELQAREPAQPQASPAD